LKHWRKPSHLFQFIHQVGGIFQRLLIAIMQAFGEDLIDNPIFAWFELEQEINV
jgi:hypothetical protein